MTSCCPMVSLCMMLFEGKETKDRYHYAGVKDCGYGLKQQVELASAILYAKADLLASIFPDCNGEDFREFRTNRLAYGPSFLTMSGGSGGAAILVGLFAARAGCDVREKMAFVGRLSHRGDLLGVSQSSSTMMDDALAEERNCFPMI